nr:hypothetical protein HK105_003664 [Polyrhizophydium stewartii]
MPAESDGPGALPPAQILLSPPVEHRIGQRLALVVPFGAWQVGRLLALLRSEWPARPPCQAHAPYAPFVDLVLYFEHDLLDTPFTSVDELESAVRSSPAVERCFAGVHFLSARLTETQASVPSLAAARMFFKLFAPPSALAQTFDAILYLGTATTPCRALWLDRIYEDAAFGPEFWIKGSIVRDKTYGIGGLDWGAYLHGQASLYALRDPRWHLYVLQASMRFWDNPHAHGMAFDVALDRVRADRTAVDWIEFTETAHLFVFWPLVQHWRSTPVDVADVCRRYPGTYLVAGDWLADAASARPATGSSGGGG